MGTTQFPRNNEGSVTSVSVVTANGLSGSVATPTSTPAITLALANRTSDNNLIANNLAPGLVSTATAAGTTVLTVASKGTQVFTGATTQIVTLPVVTTLPQIGFQFLIINNSSGAVTVNSSGGNAVQVLAANSRALITCVLLTGTTAASWTSTYTLLSTDVALITQTITNSDTTHAPSGDAVFDALAAIPPGITNSAGANVLTKSDGANLVASQITDDGNTVTVAGAQEMSASSFNLHSGEGVVCSGSDTATFGLTSARIYAEGDRIYIGNLDSFYMYVDQSDAGVTFNCSINVGVLPTSDPAVSGQLWNNLGVVMRSAG